MKVCQHLICFLFLSWTNAQHQFLNIDPQYLEDLFSSDNKQLPVSDEQYYSDIDYYDTDGSSEEEENDLGLKGEEEIAYGSQLPQEWQSRDKRRQVTCEVIKAREEFVEPGYEFIPSSYVNTTCVQRVGCDPAFNENSNRKQFCVVRNQHCRTHFKEMTVFKRRFGHSSWHVHKVQRVAVGCCDHH